MNRTVLITGATDGIGFETAKLFAESGDHLILHGRNKDKLEKVVLELTETYDVKVDQVLADFSSMKAVREMARKVNDTFETIDVLINNAGIFVTRDVKTVDGLDVRFAVNTLAPYILSKELFSKTKRIINLSSAAQSPVNLEALREQRLMGDGDAYAQSKLALTMFSIEMANENGPVIIAVNPKSFLGSKMVKTAYGSDGYDLRIGADILYELSDLSKYCDKSGAYYNNDIGRFDKPHPDALNKQVRQALMDVLNEICNR